MDRQEKLRLLKSLRLLRGIPDAQLDKLSDFLVPQSYDDRSTIFTEGSTGDSLYFIASGHVRISKKLDPANPAAGSKDLAILGPGDFMGEMALFESLTRSADAFASGETVLFALGHAELKRWLDSHPDLALGFFAQLVQALSGRLRRSSGELTLLFDLSQSLLEPFQSGKELLAKVLDHLMPHLGGNWRAEGYLYNEFNDEMDLVAAAGNPPSILEKVKPPEAPAANSWLDDQTYQVLFPGKKRPLGYLLFRRSNRVEAEGKNEMARSLTTIGHLVASALENLGHRTEEVLRARLKSSSQAGGL